MTRVSILACLIAFSAWIWSPNAEADERILPRTVLALVDLGEERDFRFSRLHKIAEMPLNHLGLTVRYHDISMPLPSLDDMEDVRGILTWFLSDRMPDPEMYIDWVEAAVEDGKKFVILGNPSVQYDGDGELTPLNEVNRLLGTIGLHTDRDWQNLTYEVSLFAQPSGIFDFERPMQGVLPPFDSTTLVGDDGAALLTARLGGDPERESVLVAVSPTGGYAADGYVTYTDPRTLQRFWHINPFEFFRLAFETDDLPKPDATTLSGTRVFFSHIDGDGWRNVTEIEPYTEQETLASEVILREVLEVYRQLPMTVAPIAADLDVAWTGSEETVRIAREIFSLPHIEAGSHTYSHPFYWEYFEDYDPDHEVSILDDRTDDSTVLSTIQDALDFLDRNVDGSTTEAAGVSVPRAYLHQPFDLAVEVEGSIEHIETVLPPGKRVEIFQWSGDTAPGENALRAVSATGLPNINGGDSLFDREFPSYASVSPIGYRGEGGLQLYASNGNENTYADLGRGRYFGFQHLVRTIRRTETPVRLKPFNIYFRMYSGERASSLNALLESMDQALEQEVIPIATSQFARIGEGFFSVDLYLTEPDRWRIENRGALQTIRFDRATFRSVDFDRSIGVLGQRHYQGSLYVALDPEVSDPVIALKDDPRPDTSPSASRPYLVRSNWQISALETNGEGFRFEASGFGVGEMVWKVPYSGEVEVSVTFTNEAGNSILHSYAALVSEDGHLEISVPEGGIDGATFVIDRDTVQ